MFVYTSKKYYAIIWLGVKIKKILPIILFLVLCSICMVGCHNPDDFNDLKAHIISYCNKHDINSIKIYKDTLNSSEFSEFEAFIRVENSNIIYSQYTFYYEDSSKNISKSNDSLIVKYSQASNKANFSYYSKYYLSGYEFYSNGTIDIDKYYTGLSSYMINEESKNLSSPPTTYIHLPLTMLKKISRQ